MNEIKVPDVIYELVSHAMSEKRLYCDPLPELNGLCFVGVSVDTTARRASVHLAHVDIYDDTAERKAFEELAEIMGVEVVSVQRGEDAYYDTELSFVYCGVKFFCTLNADKEVSK